MVCCMRSERPSGRGGGLAWTLGMIYYEQVKRWPINKSWRQEIWFMIPSSGELWWARIVNSSALAVHNTAHTSCDRLLSVLIRVPLVIRWTDVNLLSVPHSISTDAGTATNHSRLHHWSSFHQSSSLVIIFLHTVYSRSWPWPTHALYPTRSNVSAMIIPYSWVILALVCT